MGGSDGSSGGASLEETRMAEAGSAMEDATVTGSGQQAHSAYEWASEGQYAERNDDEYGKDYRQVDGRPEIGRWRSNANAKEGEQEGRFVATQFARAPTWLRHRVSPSAGIKPDLRCELPVHLLSAFMLRSGQVSLAA